MNTRGAPADLARGLGFFSMALGLGEYLAPRTMARTLGMPHAGPLLRSYGLREIATGAAILAADDPRAFVWGRVGGDALDIATLMLAAIGNRRPKSLLVALLSVAGVTALDVICAQALEERKARRRRPFDYSDRVGFPRAPMDMRGAGRKPAGGEKNRGEKRTSEPAPSQLAGQSPAQSQTGALAGSTTMSEPRAATNLARGK